MARKGRSVVIDPFDETQVLMDASEAEPMYSPAGDKSYYIWNGRKFPRVTKILEAAPGTGLMHYHGMMAALSAAGALVHGGLYVPKAAPNDARTDFEPDLDQIDQDDADFHELQAQLEQYVNAQAIRPLSHAEAISMACDWQNNMKAADRYRDHKGRIGSVAHYCKHDLAMGIRTQIPDVDYLMGIASSKNVVPDYVFARYEMLGKDREAVIRELAFDALPHALNVWDFIEDFRPEYEAVGLEAIVVNTKAEYAGSLDDYAWYRKSVWQEANDGKWPFDPGVNRALVLGDLKTSNKLARSARFQMAAYAKATFIGDFATCSETPIPEFDGLVAMHSVPGEGMKVSCFAKRHIDSLYEGFEGLNTWYRAISSMPRASQGRKDKAPVKGSRPSPIAIGRIA